MLCKQIAIDHISEQIALLKIETDRQKMMQLSSKIKDALNLLVIITLITPHEFNDLCRDANRALVKGWD